MKVKLWRRAFAASMSAVMLLGLTACGGSNESSDGIKTFTMFTAMPGSEINDDNDVMNIIAEKTGAKLKETWLTGQTTQKPSAQSSPAASIRISSMAAMP